MKRLFYRLRDAWHADLRRELQAQTDRLIAQRKLEDLGPDRVLKFDYFGQPVRFYLPHADLDAIQTHILVNETFRDEPILRYLRQNYWMGGRIADVGANIGNHTVFFGLICQADSVVAIEPSPQIYPVLARNAGLNKSHNVTMFAGGAGRAPERAEITGYDPRNWGATSIAPKQNGTINMRPLDDIVGKCDFLKIDVEGMAADVLRGAAGILSESRPPVLIELHPHEWRDGSELLARHGYVLAKAFRQGEATIDFLFERR